MSSIEAPFTKDQVDSLNGFQDSGFMHPFTCGNDNCPKPRFEHSILYAREDGWHCQKCAYIQKWAHSFMADWSWKVLEVKWE